MMHRNINNIINQIELRNWKKNEFAKQNWGYWFHSISSYVGRIKPSFAHHLINICSDENDVILDPFCGIGTIPLEADFLKRKTIANDLNPYAYLITKAKFDRNGLQDELDYISSLKEINLETSIKNVPEWVSAFYHKKTLSEILCVRDQLFKDKKYFLIGCLLGIIHGHRPSHLSMRTGYIIPYIPNPKPEAEYRTVIPRLIAKAKRMYSDNVPENTYGETYHEDTKTIELESKSVDMIISSPPYYHTLDYVHSNRLRLWFAGIDFDEQENLSNNLIQQRHTYLELMRTVGINLFRILKDDGLCVFILGDVHLSNTKTLNTAQDISDIYRELGFKTHAIIDDEIPASRTTFVKFGGNSAIKGKKEKLDRILIMTKR